MFFFLILFGVVCALLLAVGLVRRVRERRMRVSALARSRSAHLEVQAEIRARIVWAQRAHILRLMDVGTEVVVFRLIDGRETRRGAAVFWGEIPVTLEEFDMTVPWIPMQSRVVVHREGGIDATLARTIAARTHGREVTLIEGDLPEKIERRLEMVGKVCN